MSLEDIVVLTVLTSLPLVFGLVWMIIWWSDSKGNSTKIKFSSFKKFYEVNPYRWSLCDDHVTCRIDNSFGSISTHFGFIDFYRYKLWRRNLDKRNKEKEHAKDMAIIIANVKKDIENTERVAAQKYKEAKDILTTRN